MKSFHNRKHLYRKKTGYAYSQKLGDCQQVLSMEITSLILFITSHGQCLSWRLPIEEPFGPYRCLSLSLLTEGSIHFLLGVGNWAALFASFHFVLPSWMRALLFLMWLQIFCNKLRYGIDSNFCQRYIGSNAYYYLVLLGFMENTRQSHYLVN